MNINFNIYDQIQILRNYKSYHRQAPKTDFTIEDHSNNRVIDDDIIDFDQLYLISSSLKSSHRLRQ